MINSSIVIEKLAENEEKLMRLYSIYADIFPEDEKMWTKIMLDEENHANMLRELNKLKDNNEVKFDEKIFFMGEIEESIGFLDAEIEKAKKTDIKRNYALNKSLDIELGLLEMKCFSEFTVKSGALNKVLRKLNAETKMHATLIRSKLKKNS